MLSFAFFVGIVLSLLALGTAAAYLGRVLAQWSAAFALGAAIFSLVAGLAAIFGPALRRRIPDPEITKRGSVAGAFVYGLFYTVASITTAAGPAFLFLAICPAGRRPAHCARLSPSSAVWRGAPFLWLVVFAGTVGAWLARMDRSRRIAEVASGVALLSLAVYFGRLAHTLL